jgi:hypothetical protein
MDRLADLGNGLFLERWPIADLKEQDVNAHVMEPSKFNRMVANMKKRGALESVPFCAGAPDSIDPKQLAEGIGRDDKVALRIAPPEIISGHHRVRAGRAAELGDVVVLVDRSGLTRSAITAKQLAHNALVGVDDMELVKR